MVVDESCILGCHYVNTLFELIEQLETTYLLHWKILGTLPNQQTVIHHLDNAIRTL